MATDKIEFDGVISKGQVIEYLERIVDGLRENAILVEAEDDKLLLAPAEQTRFELSASAKEGKSKLEIELTWKPEYEKDYVPQDLLPLAILSVAPTADPCAAGPDEGPATQATAASGGGGLPGEDPAGIIRPINY